MRVNAMTEKFEDVTVLGHPMLFTCLRVDRATVPEGLYMSKEPVCSPQPFDGAMGKRISSALSFGKYPCGYEKGL